MNNLRCIVNTIPESDKLLNFFKTKGVFKTMENQNNRKQNNQNQNNNQNKNKQNNNQQNKPNDNQNKDTKRESF